MNIDTDSLAPTGLPQFLPKTEQLKQALQAMSIEQLHALWACNDKLARLNYDYLQNMDLHNNLTPAILAYEGIQYRYMAPGIFEDGQFDYIEQHLRIISGFYGLLRPFDGVFPYRLEMQAKLAVGEHKNLYQFWGESLAKQLASETDFVLNLASKEYSKAVKPYLPSNVRFLTCSFGEIKNGKVIETGTKCKMARGQMVRWLAENGVTTPKDIREFEELGYIYIAGVSREDTFVFLNAD